MFSWTHDGREITRAHTQSVVGNTSTLTFHGIRNSDHGNYRCTVSSGSLSVAANMGILIVRGKIFNVWSLGILIKEL